jgi:predicted O-methyltransferase YrrM
MNVALDTWHTAWSPMWSSEESCNFRGTPIRYVKDGQAKTTDTEIVGLKGHSFYERYYQALQGVSINNILEVGVFEGASAIMFSQMWPAARIVGVDIRPENPAVLRHIERLGLSNRIKIHYGLSQDNATAIQNIIEKEFSAPLDLVVDDASHQYPLTRATFEIAFPFLRKGGIYAIEDWGWAHWPGFEQPKHWAEQPALSNLIYELTMLAASRPEFVEEMTINSVLALARKGKSTARKISLADLIRTNGRRWQHL